jgi:hypothetical protein
MLLSQFEILCDRIIPAFSTNKNTWKVQCSLCTLSLFFATMRCLKRHPVCFRAAWGSRDVFAGTESVPALCEKAGAQLATRRAIARKGLVIPTTFRSSQREGAERCPLDVSRMSETFLLPECIPVAWNTVNPGDAAGSVGRKNGFFLPGEQIRCDSDFRQVYCGTLRKERVREEPLPSANRFRPYTPLLPI